MESPRTKDDYEKGVAFDAAGLLLNSKTSFLDFIRYMHSTGEKDFEHLPVRTHHLVIIDTLQRFADGEWDKLMILMPPGAGKSVICTVQFPLWYWIRNPKHNIVVASHTKSLAEEFSRRRRSCVLSPPYQRFDMALKKESLDLQENEHGGTLACYGVEGSIVGIRSNLNLLDDPIQNSEQAANDEQLDKIMTWIDVDFRSRKVYGAKEMMVTTRWSRRDPAGRYLARIERGEENWKVLRMPLICDDPENDPCGREMGEQLWPEGFDQNYIKNAKRDPMVFQTTYQQLPYIQDGDWLGEDCLVLKKGTPDLSKMRIVIGCDLALTQSGKADYTVFAVCGLHESGYLHVLHVERNRHTPSLSVDTLFKVLERYPQAQELLLDDDPASKVFKELLLSRFQQSKSNVFIAPVMMPMKGLKKEARAINLRSLFHQRRVIIWNKEFAPVLVKELMGFPDGVKHDDQVDAIGLVAKRAIKLSTFRPKENEKKDPYEGTIMRNERDDLGRQISNLTLNALHNDKPQTLSIVRRRI